MNGLSGACVVAIRVKDRNQILYKDNLVWRAQLHFCTPKYAHVASMFENRLRYRHCGNVLYTRFL